MNDNQFYQVVGYTDEYFQRLDGHGNSGYQYSFIIKPQESLMQKTLFNATSLEETKMKLAICGFTLVESSKKIFGTTFVEYDVKKL